MKIAIADDEIIYREILRKNLSKIGHNNIVFEADSGEDLISKLEKQLPHLIFIDVVMPLVDGLNAAQIISSRYPDIVLICISHYRMESHIEKIKLIGFKGYLLKDADEEQVQSAIVSALSGVFYLDIRLIQEQKSLMSRNAECTEREMQLLQFIFDGLDISEIADKMCRTPSVVYKLKSSLMKRHKIKNESGLIRWAITKGLVQ